MSLNITTNCTHAPKPDANEISSLTTHYSHWQWWLYCITLYYIVHLIFVSNLMMVKSEMAETCSWYVM